MTEMVEPTREQVKAEALRLNAAKLVALQAQPYLASVVFALTPTRTPNLGTFASDKEWRMYYDPEFLFANTVEQVAGLILHEAGHCLRGHSDRATTFGVTPQTARLWNIAGDVLINGDLRTDNVSLPDGGVYIEMLEEYGVDSSMSTEQIFSLLREAAESQGEPNGDGDGDQDGEGGQGGDSDPNGDGDGDQGGESRGRGGMPHTDCGSAADGVRREYEVEGDADGNAVDSTRADVIRRQTARAIREHAAARGDVAAGWKRWADEILDPVVDWRKELAAQVRKTLATIRGQKNYTYARPSRRQSAMNRAGQKVVLPAMRAPEPPPIAVVFDSSGSMSDTMIGWGLSEVKSILNGIGSRRNVAIVSCDAQAHLTENARRMDDVNLVGGGGTDMRVGIDAAMDARRKPEIVIVITDGYTPWPDKPLKNATLIVALTTDDDSGVPQWAKTVKITR